LLLFCIGFYLLLRLWKETDNKIVRYQARTAFLGTFISFSLGIIADSIMPSLGIHFVRLAGLFSTIYVLSFAYIIVRYDFMQINPERAASRIITTLPDPLLIIDTNLNIVLINQVATKMLGYSEAEAVGHPVGRIFAQTDPQLSGENLEAVIKAGEIRTYESVLIAKNMEQIPVILSYSITRDITGEPIGLVLIAKDIREKNEMIKRLEDSQIRTRENSTRLNTILSNMNEGIFIEDGNHEIRYMNNAALNLLGSRVGQKCFETALGGSADHPACAAPQIIDKKLARSAITVNGKNNKLFEVIGSPLRNPDGSLFALEILKDVTEGKEPHVIELEKEVNSLLIAAGQEPKYQRA
jgi:PAS domain S-box-containing protein